MGNTYPTQLNHSVINFAMGGALPPTRNGAPMKYLDKHFKLISLMPALLVLALLTVYPILALIRMSVSSSSFEQGKIVWQFVGLANFSMMFNDPTAIASFINTLKLVVASVLIETFFGLALALLVSRTKTLNLFYRTVVILPLLIPPIAIGAMWFMMLQYNFGMVNAVLLKLGIAGPLWLADPGLAFFSVLLVDIWHWTSFQFLILLSGIESLPHELEEAAKIDGASERQILRFVMLPLLRPIIIVAVTLRTIFAFKVFEQIYLLTGGGPGNATEVISSYVETVSFEQGRLGYGSAISLVTALAITAFIVFYQLVLVRREASS